MYKFFQSYNALFRKKIIFSVALKDLVVGTSYKRLSACIQNLQLAKVNVLTLPENCSAVREAAARLSQRAAENRAGGRGRDRARAGNIGGRPGAPRALRLRGLPLGRHRQVRRGPQALRHHQHARHEASRPALPSYAQS